MRKLLLVLVFIFTLFAVKSQTLDSVYHTEYSYFFEDINSPNSTDSLIDMPILFTTVNDTSYVSVGRRKLRVESLIARKISPVFTSRGYLVFDTSTDKDYMLILTFINGNQLMFVNFSDGKSLMILKIKEEVCILNNN